MSHIFTLASQSMPLLHYLPLFGHFWRII